MKLLLLVFFITPSLVNATLNQKEYESILTKSIYKEMYKRIKNVSTDIKEEVEVQTVKNLSPGEIMIEKMKAKNRAKIARMRGLDPSKIKSGEDIVNGQKKANKAFIKKISKIKKEQEKLKNRSLTSREWDHLYSKLYIKWEKEKKEFVKNLPKYQENQFDIPTIRTIKVKQRRKKTNIKINQEYIIVQNALEIPIRDQKFRPTCSSFAGIRAIEIGLKQKNLSTDLSEQYFYWASKPKCRNRRCKEKGSWVGYGFDYLKTSNEKIPKEKQCPYKAYSINFNETQIPLKSGCSNGNIDIGGYYYVKTLDGMVNQIKNNKPVIIGLKLTPNFYKNNGLILYSERNKGQKMMDGHASGHAAIIIGIVKLSPYLNEGKYCFILANSWGTGWGRGGYSCISEKWLLHQRGRNPMVVTY